MSSQPLRARLPLAERVGVGLAAAGVIGLTSGFLIATLAADHSSSDSSLSSLIAIGLLSAGGAAIGSSAVLFTGIGVLRLWRRLTG